MTLEPFLVRGCTALARLDRSEVWKIGAKEFRLMRYGYSSEFTSWLLRGTYHWDMVISIDIDFGELRIIGISN